MMITDSDGLGWLSHLPEPVVGCWYLDRHWDIERNQRTAAGQLLYDAKTYGDKLGEPQAARRLGELMAARLGSGLSLGKFPMDQVSLVVAVPAYPVKLPHNLPDVLADRVAAELDRPFWANCISKVKRSAAKLRVVPATADDYRINQSVAAKWSWSLMTS